MKGLEMNEISNGAEVNCKNALIGDEAHRNYLDVEESFYEFLKDMKNLNTNDEDFSSLFIYL